MRPIYISYRLQDRDVVERLVTRALQSYGAYSVLMNPLDSKPDQEPIEPHVEMMMSGCRQALIVVGSDWAGLDEYGRFKLSTADVPIYAELKAALTMSLEVIVVLVKDAHLPSIDLIPEEFHGLLTVPVVTLRPNQFMADLNDLIPPPTLSGMLRYWLSLDWYRPPAPEA